MLSPHAAEDPTPELSAVAPAIVRELSPAVVAEQFSQRWTGLE